MYNFLYHIQVFIWWICLIFVALSLSIVRGRNEFSNLCDSFIGQLSKAVAAAAVANSRGTKGLTLIAPLC